jgi:hypothetical protein
LPTQPRCGHSRRWRWPILFCWRGSCGAADNALAAVSWCGRGTTVTTVFTTTARNNGAQQNTILEHNLVYHVMQTRTETPGNSPLGTAKPLLGGSNPPVASSLPSHNKRTLKLWVLFCPLWAAVHHVSINPRNRSKRRDCPARRQRAIPFKQRVNRQATSWQAARLLLQTYLSISGRFQLISLFALGLPC